MSSVNPSGCGTVFSGGHVIAEQSLEEKRDQRLQQRLRRQYQSQAVMVKTAPHFNANFTKEVRGSRSAKPSAPR